jgi:hypothetical protein
MVPRFDSETKRNVAYIFSNGYPRKGPPCIAATSLTRIPHILKNLRRRENRIMGKLQVNIG